MYPIKTACARETMMDDFMVAMPTDDAIKCKAFDLITGIMEMENTSDNESLMYWYCEVQKALWDFYGAQKKRCEE